MTQVRALHGMKAAGQPCLTPLARRAGWGDTEGSIPPGLGREGVQDGADGHPLCRLPVFTSSSPGLPEFAAWLTQGRGFIMHLSCTTALAALVAAGLATAADARRVTVDDNLEFDLGACALDVNLRTDTLCQPVNLGFNIRVTIFEDDEFGDIFDDYTKVVLFDDGLIRFVSVDPNLELDLEWPEVFVNLEEQDFQPLGQFARKGNSGDGFFEVLWLRARVTWSCNEYDEFNPKLCIDGFFTTFEQAPHARLLIESLPKNSTRFTLRWTEGASNFGYWLGTDVRALGGNGERRFQFTIGSVVPEPASWAMMIAGFGLVGTAARKRRRLSAA